MSYVFGVPTKRHVEYRIKKRLDPLNSLHTWHRSWEGTVQPGEDEEEEDANSNTRDHFAQLAEKNVSAFGTLWHLLTSSNYYSLGSRF
jgi:hypothetical protein